MYVCVYVRSENGQGKKMDSVLNTDCRLQTKSAVYILPLVCSLH